jgi:tRNA pseudouridine38-40 synthase
MRARLLIAYDGTGFRGFAQNEGVRTVMGVLTDAISLVVRAPVELTGAGRTDAGVHAWGQVVSGDLPDDTDLDALVRRLNKLCAPDVAVRSAAWTLAHFDARFSAMWRHYRYHVWNVPTPNPLLAARAWWVHQPLDLGLMNAAAGPLVGEHDFGSFCRRVKVGDDEPEKSLVRNVVSAAWCLVDDLWGGQPTRDAGSAPHTPRLLRFEIRANAFCHQMVRSITGTLVDIGMGKLGVDAVPNILAARDRQVAGQVAPAHGLTLWEVGYPE